MDLERPFAMTFRICVCAVDFEYMNVLLRRGGLNSSFTVVARRKMSYHEFVSLIYEQAGLHKKLDFQLKISLDLQDFQKPKPSSIESEECLDITCSKHGKPKSSMYLQPCGKTTPIMSEETLDLMYFLAERDESFWAQICVEFVRTPKTYY